MASGDTDSNADVAPEGEAAAPAHGKSPDAGQSYPPDDVRIIVVDDDPAIGRLVEATLTGHDFEIDIVSDPGQVEAALRRRQYHVVILDYVLPGLESNFVLNLVRETQPVASVIVVTAFPSVDSARECMRAQTFDYITKPFQVDHLKKTVLRALENRSLLRLSEEVLREQLGAAIRERRKALGLTLAEMAKRCNLSLGYLSQVELGRSSASIETLYRISLALRQRLADLFHAVETTA